ncbi:MAG: SMC family ATPase, partial [Actinobacteria bacterium]|nr:SMC family ATPase [Actinomycetota bacterium]
MRPLRIEFAAFGPYPERVVVDFAALTHRGLFVIAGDTGTGKTTIFDAMLYALFGRTRVDAEEVRSHHADSDVRTAVRFDFEAGGTHYVVERSPAQLRPKTRGSGTTTQAASASLVRIEANGTTTSLTTRANDVTVTCAALVGLDAAQFQRVVLLPQGEFARFLTAPAGEREALLTKLFGGAAHEALAVALRQRATSAREAVADVTSRAAALHSVWTDVVVGAASTH